MSQNARVGKSSPVISQVNVARVTLRSHTIADWQQAVNAARNELVPRRRQLYELYENLRLDGHLSAVMGKRTLNVTNKQVIYVDPAATEGQQESIRDYILKTPWFYDFLQGSMEVVPYGTTLLELIPKAGMIDKCEVFPRANVVPERGWVTNEAINPELPWLYYREDKYYSTYLVEVGRPKDLGAMMIALPYVMYKRGALGDWAQFAELFGMPFRVGKYNPFDEGTRQKLLSALAEMGGAGYAVIPDGTSLDFHNANAGSNQSALYKDLYEACNSELSKIFLGQTMTTDQGSSRSQGEVHERVEDGITLADMRRTEFLLNWELHPRLEKLGYPVSKGRFEFDLTRNLPLEKRIELDTKVAQQLGGQVPARYWYDTYGIPEPGKGDKVILPTPPSLPGLPAPAGEPATPPANPEPDPDDEADPAADSATLRRELRTLYRQGCGHRHADHAAGDEEFDGSDPIMQELAKAIHDGRIRDGWVDPKLFQWTADQLTKAVMGGSTGDPIADDGPASESDTVQEFIRRNVAVFSGFKTYQTLRAATDELMDADGNFRSYADFKRRILALNEQYNVNYLRAEYNHAVASAQMAERWQEIQRRKDRYPYLRYRTVGDDRVREAHARMNGVTKHVNDPYWDKYYPPNDWECRCDVEQVAGSGGRDLPESQYPPLRPMFANNVGKDGIVFPLGHPYYNAPAEVRAQAEEAANMLLLDRLLRRVWKRKTASTQAVRKELREDFTKRVMPGLSKAQETAFERYTQHDYGPWNTILRNDPSGRTAPAEVHAMREAMAASPIAKDVQVFRGIRSPYDAKQIERYRKMPVGTVFRKNGFFSSSIDPQSRVVNRGDLVLRVHVPKGAKAMYIESMSYLPEEMEMLLDHFTKFRFLGMENANGKTYVNLTVIP